MYVIALQNRGNVRETGIEISRLKLRLDKLLVDRGHAASRERAQALILAGRVLVNEQKVDKPGAQVGEDANLRLLGEDLRYVSRGGLKLEHALATWSIDVTGWRARMWARRRAGLPTACCSTERRVYGD